MAEDKEKSKVKKPTKSTKKTPKTTPYVLITDVSIGGKIHKKGTKYPLTEKGAEYFKSKHYIK